jgi:hypothetical protein
MEKEITVVSRRNFLKTSTIAAAGVAVTTVLPQKAKAAGQAWTNGMQINPNIDNLRVVCCYDESMIASELTTKAPSFLQQNTAINTSQVMNNLDRMAIQLAQKSTAVESWATIFQKPAAKEWGQVKCAIKVNCINSKNMPRVAVVGKICKELINLGVTPSNIVLYDGCSGASGNGKYSNTTYYATVENPNLPLPQGIVVSNYNTSLNGTTDVMVNSSGTSCTKDLADGIVDILINCAVNKHHSSGNGNVTMCMKNHFGTFSPNCGNFNYIVGINKHDAIVGGTPVRQQLCVMDTLWASYSGGPGDDISHAPARLVMGTFGAAVDYLTATKIHRDIMGGTLNSTTEQFITAFGYTTEQRDALAFVNVDPTSAILSAAPRINALNQKSRQRMEGTYTVTGQKVSGNKRPTGGVYIKNGKKIRK